MWRVAIQYHTFFRRKFTPATEAANSDKHAKATGKTLFQAQLAAKRRATTAPQEGGLRKHLERHGNAIVDRSGSHGHGSLPSIVPPENMSEREREALARLAPKKVCDSV